MDINFEGVLEKAGPCFFGKFVDNKIIVLSKDVFFEKIGWGFHYFIETHIIKIL